MAQAQAPTREQTPEEFARQLGLTESRPDAPAQDLTQPPAEEDFAAKLGMQPVVPSVSDPGIVINNNGWSQFWRSMYATIPDVTGMLGGAVGAATGFTAGTAAGGVNAPAGAFLGAETGAGAGGIVGRGIQEGIDELLDRPKELRNVRGYGEEASRQMAYEGAGRIFSRVLQKFGPRGVLKPRTQAAADRKATNDRYGLSLAPAEISDSPKLGAVEWLARRGVFGSARQKTMQARTDAAAQKAISSILDTVSAPSSTTGAGALAQETIQDAAARGTRRVEGSIATNLAPRTGQGATGQMTEAGVQGGRTAFARQGDAFEQMKKNAPPVDVSELHEEAWRVFNDDVMPKLVENPSLGPKSPEWQKVVRMYRTASANGSRLELSPSTKRALAEAALEKAPYGPLRVINQILATPREMTFSGALALRSTLRDAGKGENLLAGDAAEALATFFETGSRTSAFKGIRGILNETHAPYEAAAEAYRTNRNLFQSALVEKAAEANPEAVLATLTTAEGRFNASRVRQMARVLQDLPQTYGTPAEIEAGAKAWNTLRAEWFRRDVVQDNVFGLADRMRKVDPDVLQAWFPDLAGKNVLRQAQVTGQAFESQLLGQIAEADPSKVVAMIGASPQRVREFITRINALPGPVQRGPMIDKVRRAWTESTLVSGDLGKLSERINKSDPELLATWFDTPQEKAALNGLRRIGDALSTRVPVQQRGAYESVGAVTIVGAVLTGNIPVALTLALGYEGVPAFVSWAMYNPSVQKYLFEAGASNATVTSRTASLLHALGAYRSAQQGSQ